MSNPQDPDNEMEKLIKDMKAKLTSIPADSASQSQPLSVRDIIEILLELEISCLYFARESMNHSGMQTIGEESINRLEKTALRTSTYLRMRLGLPAGGSV